MQKSHLCSHLAGGHDVIILQLHILCPSHTPQNLQRLQKPNSYQKQLSFDFPFGNEP